MFCERYQETLIEAAAACDSDSPLPLDLRAHLDSCASCYAAFDEERHLLAAIDSGIRQRANMEVPASLFATVRVRLVEEGPSSVTNLARSSWEYAAAAAVLLAVVLMPFLGMRKVSVESLNRKEHANLPGSSVGAVSPISSSDKAREIGSASSSGSRSARSIQARATAPTLVSASSSMKVRVLVPADQQALLKQYVLALRARGAAVDAVDQPASPIPVETRLSSIDIAELQFPPLADLATR
jgi:hypothetical protein